MNNNKSITYPQIPSSSLTFVEYPNPLMQGAIHK